MEMRAATIVWFKLGSPSRALAGSGVGRAKYSSSAVSAAWMAAPSLSSTLSLLLFSLRFHELEPDSEADHQFPLFPLFCVSSLLFSCSFFDAVSKLRKSLRFYVKDFIIMYA